MKEKLPLSCTVVVEGRYDRARIEEIFDAAVITTEGFRVFSDRERLELIRRAAKCGGIAVAADPDSAGGVIRSFLKGSLEGEVTFVLLPRVKGVERRKRTPSKQGYLGLEGLPREEIVAAFERAGLLGGERRKSYLDRARMYEDGLLGSPLSGERRQALLRRAGLPDYLSTSQFCELVGLTLAEEEYSALLEEPPA